MILPRRSYRLAAGEAGAAVAAALGAGDVVGRLTGVAAGLFVVCEDAIGVGITIDGIGTTVGTVPACAEPASVAAGCAEAWAVALPDGLFAPPAGRWPPGVPLKPPGRCPPGVRPTAGPPAVAVVEAAGVEPAGCPLVAPASQAASMTARIRMLNIVMTRVFILSPLQSSNEIPTQTLTHQSD